MRRGAIWLRTMSDLIDPERSLALVYAPSRCRDALAVLWQLDERLGAVLDIAQEPMIRAIRLAWWREALEALDHGPPPDEPLLQALTAQVLPLGVSGKDLAMLEEGWSALVDIPPDPARHARSRGAVLFDLSARLLGEAAGGRIAQAGEGWALVDRLAREANGAGEPALRRHAETVLRSALRGQWPRPLRPLGILAMLALRDARPGGLERRRQGSPGRVARVLVMGMLGH